MVIVVYVNNVENLVESLHYFYYLDIKTVKLNLVQCVLYVV